MQQIIDSTRQSAQSDLKKVTNTQQLSQFWQEYLSKNGKVTQLMKELRNVDKNDRPQTGKLINELKQEIEQEYEAFAKSIQQLEMSARNEKEAIDITMPAKTASSGALHPITLVKNEITDAFTSMGFFVYEGPEIETDDYNFTRLNVPKDHPARDMQDTFYLSPD